MAESDRNEPAPAHLETGPAPRGSTRRDFLTGTIAALAAAGLPSAAGLAAKRGPLAGQPLRVFDPVQARTYGAWCDVLAIGADEAGVAHFVDKYLAEPPADALLLLRYLLDPPFDAFYLGGVAGIDAESRARFAKPFLALDAGERDNIVQAAATSATRAWHDPPPGLFYFVSRSDAVDTVYGTVRGFERLGVPYLPHIPPPFPW